MIKLQLGDCLELTKKMKDESVDMILTDPPYGINYSSNRRVKTEKFKKIENDDSDFRFKVYPELYRVLKNNSVCVIFCSWKNYAEDYKELEKYFDIKNVLVWYKSQGGMGDLKHTLSTDYELAIVCHKGKCKIRGKRDGSVLRYNKVSVNNMLHPTQKPTDMLSYIIEKFSDKDMIIFDPFMGSGSTGVSVIETGRNFIGMELNKEYFDIADKRIKEKIKEKE